MDDLGIDSSNDGQDSIGDAPDENINISDVIEVIQTDPDFNPNTNHKGMYSGGSHTTMPTATPSTSSQMRSRNQPEVKIIEQPASKALRFRYECEGRSAGSIPGENSTPENKTFPSIRIDGYNGRAVVVVSCVTKDPPYRPHPHNLVGREGCKRGVCTLEVSPDTMSVTFSNLGIQCVKKKDIESALKVREEIRVDPFRTGFGHRNQPTSIDLNAVRLCFQVFIEGRDKNKFTVPLTPVVSVPIYDKKAMSELAIVKLSDVVSSVDGGRKDIILLCEKVAKEDIQIRFFEEKNGQTVWEGYGDFQPSQVHKQTGIWFRAPRYKTLDVTEPVKVFIQLKRPSDGQTSEPLPFELLPLDSDSGKHKRKRQNYDFDQKAQSVLQQYSGPDNNIAMLPFLNIAPVDVKIEPRDTTPSPYLGQAYGGMSPAYVNPMSVSPSYSVTSYPVTILADPLQPTPSPHTIDFSLPTNNLGILQTLPPISDLKMGNWPNMSFQNDLSGATGMNIDSAASLSLLDMDTKELQELKSGELNLLDANNLSESLYLNLSLSDCNILNPENNMTDSLTRLANTTMDKIVQLNEMCKPENL